MSATNTLTDAERVAIQQKCVTEHMRAENAHDPGGHPNCPTYGHPNCSTLAAVI